MKKESSPIQKLKELFQNSYKSSENIFERIYSIPSKIQKIIIYILAKIWWFLW